MPPNYFDNFSENVLSKITLQEQNVKQELESIGSMLADFPKEDVFSVPLGYFNEDNFSEKVQAHSIESKVVEHPAVKSIKWARWAAAASVIAIFSISGFQFLNNTPLTANAKFEQSLSQIPDSKIQDWLSFNLGETDSTNFSTNVANADGANQPDFNNLSSKEINDYLDNEVW